MSFEELDYSIPNGYRLSQPNDTILPYDKIYVPESDDDGKQIGGEWVFIQMDDSAVGFTSSEISNPIVRPRIRMLAMVEEFHENFDPGSLEKGEAIPFDLRQLRQELIEEELLELKKAMLENDSVEVLDALCDLTYVVFGAVHKLGFSDVFLDAFVEVHTSNMSKLNEDGKPVYREDGKILKGSNYKEPDLEKFIEKAKKAV